MALRLRVVSADGRRFEHEVEGDSLIVGRSSRAGLALADRAMSREHARLQHGPDGWVIEDLGSHNGTRVNEIPIEGPHRLRDGDTVSLGGSVFVVEVKGEDEVPSGDSVIYRSAKEMLQAASGSTDVSGIGSSGRKAADRLHMLNQVNQALASSISLEELLELILDRAFEHLKPQEAAIYLRDAAGNDVCAARRSIKGRESKPMHSRSLLHEVIDKGMVAHVVDSSVDERFSESKSLMMSGLRSFIAAPLLDAQGALGMVVVGAALGVRSFRDEDLELLVSLASVAALRIRNVRLVAEAMERQKLEQEVRLARQIQVALLPASLPPVPGLGALRRNAPLAGRLGRLLQDPPARGRGHLRALRRRRVGKGGRGVAPDRLPRGPLGAPARGDRPARSHLREGRQAPSPEDAPREVRDGLPRDLRPFDGRPPLDERGAQPRPPPPGLGRVRVAEGERHAARAPPGGALQGGRDGDRGRRRPPRLHRRHHGGVEPGRGGVRGAAVRRGGRPAPAPRPARDGRRARAGPRRLRPRRPLPRRPDARDHPAEPLRESAMFLRLVRLKLRDAAFWSFRDYYEARILPALAETEGCLYAALLRSAADPGFTTCDSLTLWESSAYADAYVESGLYDELLDGADPFLATATEWKTDLAQLLPLQRPPLPDPAVETFPVEVARNTPGSEGCPALFLRIVDHRVEPARFEELRDTYEKSVAPALLETPGCVATYLVEVPARQVAGALGHVLVRRGERRQVRGERTVRRARVPPEAVPFRAVPVAPLPGPRGGGPGPEGHGPHGERLPRGGGAPAPGAGLPGLGGGRTVPRPPRASTSSSTIFSVRPQMTRPAEGGSRASGAGDPCAPT